MSGSDELLHLERTAQEFVQRQSFRREGTRGCGGFLSLAAGGAGSKECNLQLAIYATDAERTRHTEQFPNRPLPEKRDRLTRRDWRLPRPPF